LGKYSKVLEKARDESESIIDETLDGATDLVDEAAETGEPEATGAKKLQHSPPENRAAAIRQEDDIALETGGWDDKLQEIVSGRARAVAENIKMLRTKIYYPESGSVPRSIMVTSAIPGEGKSFICANLGVSIAQGIGKEALLVEADLRRPSLSKYFGLKKSKGLVDYLQKGTPVEQVIQQTSVPGLSLLSSGEPPKNPAELLDTEKMASLLQSLEEQNPDRIIIFDSPPVQVASETNILAKRVDKIILVFRWGFAKKEHAMQLVDMITKEKILGVVFNAFEMTRLEAKLQGYYYGYKDYYYSRSAYSKYYE
jgi:capsular exopolysaccharide synthesis family protein